MWFYLQDDLSYASNTFTNHANQTLLKSMLRFLIYSWIGFNIKILMSWWVDGLCAIVVKGMYVSVLQRQLEKTAFQFLINIFCSIFFWLILKIYQIGFDVDK